MHESVRDTLDFVLGLRPEDLTPDALHAARRHLLDLVGVAAAGSTTALGRIAAGHALEAFGRGDPGPGGGTVGARVMFDGRVASPVGAAFANATRIDSVDAHDGHRLTKGHAGCGVLAAALAAAELRGAGAEPVSEAELLTALVVGFEVGTRAGIALHATAADYHTSGAWVALAAAAVVARTLGLDAGAAREAIGVAEYHGPRSPMMRVIDHPSMLKDGSGWGAMAGVSAALLARRGFTGAPAATLEGEDVAGLWADLGTRWRIGEQYFKPQPVCRWAQPAVAAALALRAAHGLGPDDVRRARVGTFAQAARLDARAPVDTEAAQYSLPFPVAAALVHGEVGLAQIAGAGLADRRTLALAASMEVHEVGEYVAAFPGARWSDVTLELADGRTVASGRTAAPGDPETPLDDAALGAKLDALAGPALGGRRAAMLREALEGFGSGDSLAALDALIYPRVEAGP